MLSPDMLTTPDFILSQPCLTFAGHMRLPIDEYVLIGQMAGRIVRHHDQGIGIEFVGQPKRTTHERLNAKFALAS
jgi:hypothetical protein